MVLLFLLLPFGYGVYMDDRLEDGLFPSEFKRNGMTPEEHREWLAAKLVFNRLCLYTGFTTAIVGVGFLPFYTGENYADVLEAALAPLAPSLSFWVSVAGPRVALARSRDV